jgi:uncharacterized Ntn-hydrolase superfamily protein
MTWSILARNDDGAFGIAIASRFFAVGVLCPYLRAGVGAVSTQALVNPTFGPWGLDLLSEGVTPTEVVRVLASSDDGRAQRQVHVLDRNGIAAAHTGAQCIEWRGHIAGHGWSVAGNMLTGPDVLAATAKAYADARDLPFAERLLAALAAGEAAGGDKRGKQGAALRIVTTESYPALDLRVDDHDAPLVELRRLYEKSLERFQPFVSCLPSRARPAGITDRAEIDRVVERFTAARRGGSTR